MTGQRRFTAALVASALMLAVPASAQNTAQNSAQAVTSTDIQRLQDDVYQASTDISRLRSSDATEASRLQAELDDLRDEVTYLKVKLRREGNVSRSGLHRHPRPDPEPARPRTWRRHSRGLAGLHQRPPVRSRRAGRPTRARCPTIDGRRRSSRVAARRIPDGQEIDVRLERELNSGTAQVEDRFEATTVVDMYDGNRVLIPAGSVMRGVVSSVDKAIANRPEGQSDRRVRSGDRARPGLPYARHRHAGARERRDPRGSGEDRRRVGGRRDHRRHHRRSEGSGPRRADRRRRHHRCHGGKGRHRCRPAPILRVSLDTPPDIR